VNASGATLGRRTRARVGAVSRAGYAPQLAMLIVIAVWSSGPLISRSMSVSGTVAATWRMWMAVPLSIGLAAWRGTPLTFHILRRTVPSGFFFVSSFIVFYEAVHRTSVANATLISTMLPVVLMVLAWPLFGERFDGSDIGWAALALAGIAVFVLAGRSTGHSGRTGDVLAVVNLLLSVGYFLEMKRLRATVPVAAFLAGTFTMAAVFATPYAVVTGAPLGSIRTGDLLRLAVMVIGPGMVGHGLMTWVQRHVPVGVASMLTLASNVLTSVGAWVVFGQRLGGVQILGGLLALAAVGALLQHRSRPNPVGLDEAAVL
jgi:drug/metabolite transporter (DMT)-like permease